MTRNYAAEYRAACIADRTPGASLAERCEAQARMVEIFESAIDADVLFDCYGIDEQVRLELYPTTEVVR